MTAIIIFALAALILAPISGGNVDRLILRVVVELPLLLIVAGIGLLAINLIATSAGALFKGSVLIAAATAAVIAWAIAGGTSPFAGLGYHSALRPAYAISVALPWLFRANLSNLMTHWRDKSGFHKS
ncbi:MAG: hypothetical protein WDM89_14580 [Rhizomicrobium sp.]